MEDEDDKPKHEVETVHTRQTSCWRQNTATTETFDDIKYLTSSCRRTVWPHLSHSSRYVSNTRYFIGLYTPNCWFVHPQNIDTAQFCVLANSPLHHICVLFVWWHQRADERHGNRPPRLPGAISGQRQSWKTPGELEVSKYMGCDIFASVLWQE